MSGKRRGSHEEESENRDRWLVSYADFMTLLFAFFVVMYAVSSVSEGKFRVLSESLIAVFHTPPQSLRPIQLGNLARAGRPTAVAPSLPLIANLNPLSMPIIRPVPHPRISRSDSTPQQSVAPTEAPDRPALKEASAMDRLSDPLNQIIKRLQASMSEWIHADLVKVRRNHLQIEVEINNNVLFTSGSAVLNEQAKAPLRELAAVLQGLSNRVHVEGFTDNKPISTPIYPSNWELSAARAASVVHLLMQAGVRPERMTAIGYGEYRPVEDNTTEEGRMRNRRVVLVILAGADDSQEMAENTKSTVPDTALITNRMAMQADKSALHVPGSHGE